MASQHPQNNGNPRAVMIRNLTSKLVYRPTGVSELYDLTLDPRETRNLYLDPAYSSLRANLTAQLLDWMVLTSDITPDNLDSRDLPPFPNPIAPDPWAPEYFPQTQTPPSSYLRVNGVREE